MFSELIRQQEESGLTIKDFCFNQGIARSTFHYWRKEWFVLHGMLLIEGLTTIGIKPFSRLVFLSSYASNER